MREQVINAINEFYSTHSSKTDMFFVDLMETLNLNYNNDADKSSLDKVLRQLQADGFIVSTFSADNVFYNFKKR